MATIDEGMAISKETAEKLSDICKRINPKKIVELGTGAGYSLATLVANTTAEIWSVDDNQRFFQLAKDHLSRQGLSLEKVHFVHAPIINASDAQRWYSPAVIGTLPNDIDLLFVDGPAGHIGRYLALPFLLKKLSSHSVILLDDCNRPGEQQVFRSWIKRLTENAYTFDSVISPTDRGLGILEII